MGGAFAFTAGMVAGYIEPGELTALDGVTAKASTRVRIRVIRAIPPYAGMLF